MANFLLIHGAWQGKWIWSAVSAELTMRGHEVHAIDLPGSGEDTTPVGEVTLERYADAIRQAIVSIGKRVTLVGHSLGGIAVAAAAEKNAQDVARIIYLGGYVPGDGESIDSLSDVVLDKEAVVLDMQGDDQIVDTQVDTRVTRFMHDAPHAIATWAAPQFRAQAVAPIVSPVQLTEERYGKLPKSYVICTDDRMLDPVLQRVMAARAGCTRVKEIDSGHSPFLSRPTETAETLHRLVTEL